MLLQKRIHHRHVPITLFWKGHTIAQRLTTIFHRQREEVVKTVHLHHWLVLCQWPLNTVSNFYDCCQCHVLLHHPHDCEVPLSQLKGFSIVHQMNFASWNLQHNFLCGSFRFLQLLKTCMVYRVFIWWLLLRGLATHLCFSSVSSVLSLVDNIRILIVNQILVLNKN
ncbi:hypothetical protein V8G54_012548 [Vigna mungo]|uniref:Uncharacterized protein n=1 Tax=Vigna mungo TaxID=3915 RepID=A0AAQ3NTV7_VIGMU